jgi:hypothetical protein
MKLTKMSVLNDDGYPLDLRFVLTLLLMPNFILILLTTFNLCVIHASKNHPRLNQLLGKLAKFFSKGALDRIIRNMLRRFELKKRTQDGQSPMVQLGPFNIRKSSFQNSCTANSESSFDKKYDANYLFLVPFQFDLLFTIFVYKILTRDVYPETCQSYLTTYHNRQKQVMCWLKDDNKNISNLSFNITLYQYCTNQSITYINYEHNDVVCTQYVFKLINIIDTVTNMFAWHQAVVFIVTKSIVFSYWYQHKLRKTGFWSNLFNHQRRIILFITICLILSIYILLFVLILPASFLLIERRRVDLTRHLLYACSKFVVATIVHVNLYTLYQWHLLIVQKHPTLTLNEEKIIHFDQPGELTVSIGNSVYNSPPSTMMIDDYLKKSPKYLAPDILA